MGDPLESRWRSLDERIRGWWDDDLHRADEDAVRDDPDGTLLYLPHPYSSAAGAHAAFPEMYGWDTYFINCGLLAHGRLDLVRNHVLNQIHQIEQYGFVPNGNRSFYLTRSQPPMLGESVYRYVAASNDLQTAARALPALQREYEHFWDAPPRLTPTGLATCHDTGDPRRRAALAAEAESGRDFTAIHGGDVRRCVPLNINSALVRYAKSVAAVADLLGHSDLGAVWRQRAEERARRVRHLCWSREASTFLQWDWVAQHHLPYRSLDALWPLWAGIATVDQAEAVADDLDRFLCPYGLAFTDVRYPSPHPEYDWLQWGYPSGWPPEQLIAVEALDAYRLHDRAIEVARRYLAAQIDLYDRTGQLWEKLDVTTGGLDLPTERYAVPPFHGWSSASVVILGRRLFGEEGPDEQGGASPI